MHRKKFPIAWAAAIGVAVIALGAFAATRSSARVVPAVAGLKAVVVRSATCGCCGNFVAYLKRKGFEVETKFVEDSAKRRADAGVPDKLGSCHTTYVGGYVVEGHVPVEAIDKLLKEKPSVKGIGMPGMPSGSPGMPGPKTGPFTISSFQEDGTTSPFMEL